jgi:hypothetical protein
MTALAPLIGACLTILACYALGSLLLSRFRLTLLRAEKAPLAFLLGAALLHFFVFTALALHIAYIPVFASLLLAILTAALWTNSFRLPAQSNAPESSTLIRIVRLMFAATAGTFTLVYIFCAWAPEISPDGTAYHLPLIARYLHAHGFEPVPTNFYSTLSEGIEMIFLPAFAIAQSLLSSASDVVSLAGSGSAAALVHLAFLVALALSIRAFGHRTGHALAGEASALLVYLSPVAGTVGTSAYVDLGAASVVFGTFYFTQLWDQTRHRALLVCIGLLAGYCYAAKYTAALMAVYALAYVLWRARSLRPVLVIATCAAIMIAPWLLKDWIYVHNPIAPFANQIFRNPFIHPDVERLWREVVRSYAVTDRSALARMAFLTGGVLQNPLGPIFLLAPLALLALRKPLGRRVLLPAALLLATYPANIQTRFLLPALPFVAFAFALVLENLPLLLVLLIAFHATASWPRNLRRYASPDAWVLRRTPIRAALRQQSENDYLNEVPNYRLARFIERTVPPGETLLATSSVADYYTSHEILVRFGGARNDDLMDVLYSAWYAPSRPSLATVIRFPARTMRRLRVVQTATMPKADELWSVHELRFFLDGQEVPRTSAWHLRAFPNPWGVGSAFDNSPVTRWRTWETATPGNFIDVDFGAPKRINQLRLETSADNPDIRLRLEHMNPAGQWEPLASDALQFTLTPETSLRFAATSELRAQGVRYILVRDNEPGADVYAQDPSSWNFSIAGRTEGVTIYKIEGATIYKTDRGIR